MLTNIAVTVLWAESNDRPAHPETLGDITDEALGQTAPRRGPKDELHPQEERAVGWVGG